MNFGPSHSMVKLKTDQVNLAHISRLYTRPMVKIKRARSIWPIFYLKYTKLTKE